MTAPVITIYRNGDGYYNGKRLVLNRKEIRSFDAFLDRVTNDTRSKVAIRSIRTPCHGHRVAELDKLENGGIYVAVGPEKFKKLEYKEVSNLPTHRQKPPDQVIKPVVHSRVIVSGRARKVAAAEIFSNKNIFVYRNGEDKHPCYKIHLDKRILHTNMNTILQFITEKVNLRTGAVKSLHTLDGIEIQEPSQLKTLEKYVAVGYGKKFLKMAYNENSFNSTTPRRGGPKIKSNSSEPPFRKKKLKPPVKAMSQGHVKSPPKPESEKAPDEPKPFLNENSQADAPSDANSIKADENEAQLVRGMTHDLSQNASRASTKHENEKVTQDLENLNEATSIESNVEETDAQEDGKRKSVSERKKSDAVNKRKQSKAKKSVSSDAGSVKSKKNEEIKKTDEEVELPEEDSANTDRESTVFKATGKQGESATAVKDTDDTNVDKPVDMLPAEEVEEELPNEDGNIENNTQKSQEETANEQPTNENTEEDSTKNENVEDNPKSLSPTSRSETQSKIEQ